MRLLDCTIVSTYSNKTATRLQQSCAMYIKYHKCHTKISLAESSRFRMPPKYCSAWVTDTARFWLTVLFKKPHKLLKWALYYYPFPLHVILTAFSCQTMHFMVLCSPSD